MRLFLIMSAFLLILVEAHAQTSTAPPSSDLLPSEGAAGDKLGAITSKACRGPTEPTLQVATGLPNNRPDDMHCQYIWVLASQCANLAYTAGGYESLVLSGQGNYLGIANELMNSTTANPVGLQAVYLAEQAGPNESPGQLVQEVFDNCTAQIASQ